VIILLLFCGLIENLTDIIWCVDYYWTGFALSSTPAFCITWIFISSTLYVSVSILTAWASIERHILIFHSNWLATKTKYFFFHYLPLAVCIMWPLIFYFVMFIILPCSVQFNFQARLCGRYSCITSTSWIALLDGIANYMIPAFSTIIFSVGLLVRVIYQKHRIRQRIEWRNYRNMAVQLLPVSALNLALQFPSMILYTAYSAGLSRTIGTDYYSESVFFRFWIILFTPFVCAVSLPELRAKCLNTMLFWQRRPAVVPQLMATTRARVGQPTAAVMPTMQ
jgi:hypothetical protein